MWMIVFLFLVFSMNSYLDLSGYGIYIGCHWINYITYMFIHTNIIHLMTNSALFIFYWPMVRHMNVWVVMPIVVVSSLCASLLSVYEQPTVGLSAVIMSMAGIISSTLPMKRMRNTIVTVSVTFLITMVFAEQINTLIHVYSYFFSLLLSLAANRFLYDAT